LDVQSTTHKTINGLVLVGVGRRADLGRAIYRCGMHALKEPNSLLRTGDECSTRTRNAQHGPASFDKRIGQDYRFDLL
jgi:hypothetical protein